MIPTLTRRSRWLVLLFALLAPALAPAQGVPDGYARIHYLRADGDYAGWELHVWEDVAVTVSWDDGLDPAGIDEDGAYWDVPLADGAQRVGFIVHQGDLKDPGPDMFLVLDRHGREIWVRSGSAEILSQRPLPPVAEGTARIHYHRPDGDYADWELHVWDAADEQVTWQDGLDPAGESAFGLYWTVRLREDGERLGLIVHRGDEKDPGPDQFLDLTGGAREAWIVSGNATVFTSRPDLRAAGSGDLTTARAHWLAPDLIAWDLGVEVPGTRYLLHAAADGVLELTPEGVRGGETIELTRDPTGLPAQLRAAAPHLAGLDVLRLPEEGAARAAELLRGRLAVSSVREGRAIDASGLQIPWVVDALYADAAQDVVLGPSWRDGVPTVRVWAPTAREVALLLWPDGSGAGDPRRLAMERDDASGVWSVQGRPDWTGRAYRFEVEVYAPSVGALVTNETTDPYATALTSDSRHALLIDLDDPATMPDGWATFRKPGVAAPEDVVVYELHVRDFSAHAQDVPEAQRGRYGAFGHPDSAGMRHLRALAGAGLTHLHLLPTFDITTVPEDPTERREPDLPDVERPSASPAPQEAIDAVRDRDAFNWGYDPWHFGVPEGSYASDADGAARIVEYRTMVLALADAGLRVVADVVFNHTSGAGQASTSVLDRIVPGYYHRLDANGYVTTSTCCQNTATEHAMMRKLMVDMVVRWARDYRTDAFRFDLMGHHMVPDMEAVRAALDALTLERDGIDGPAVYLYGEGWDFGEVADGARGPNATQRNLAGSGIGTFNDRLRDAVRGGGPFDGGVDLLARQGFASGLGTLPNRASDDGVVASAAEASQASDWIRVGMAGNLADYRFESATGTWLTGAELDYHGAPVGYTADPQENVVYVSKHDNQTLYDILAYKLPTDLAMEDRVRLQTAALATVAFAQGVPFFHAGSDLLRSKSLDRNSYDSGDLFNAIDWTGHESGFGVGLPLAADNRSDWRFMRPLLEDPALVPDDAAIEASATWFRALLATRASSPLFRLPDAATVQERLAFHNTGPAQHPGLIVMTIDDRVGADLDPEHEAVLVVINTAPQRRTVTVDGFAGEDLRLHPAFAALEDGRLATSAFYETSGRVSVPAFTTAVFVLPDAPH